MKKIIISLICLTLALPWPLTAWAAPVTFEKERELGKRIHLTISAANVLMDDPIANKYYQSVASRIMEGAGLKPDQYNFYIVDIASVSADVSIFSMPGGYIYMHAETVMSLENEGQLASLLSHELAHITSSHFIRRIESISATNLAYWVGILAAFFTSSYPDCARGCCLITNSRGSIIQDLQLANSSVDEAEADAKGRQYLTRAGYNPQDMYGAFHIMANKTYQIHRDNPTYPIIHPDLTSRLATTFKDYESSRPSPPDLKYQAFRDRVIALAGERGQVQKVMTNRLNSYKNDHSALHALGLLAARRENLSQADKLMNLALDMEPENGEYLADLGDLALRRRQLTEAKKYYERAVQDNRQAVLGLARASELLDDNNQAATLYDRAVNMENYPYPEALELAGHFFGRNGQPAKGNYYLARYFASRGNVDQAIFHYRETVKHPEAEQYKAMANREIDILTELTKDNQK